jgi:3-dehydroquinate dehydratase/shikimate dehydrogenase
MDQPRLCITVMAPTMEDLRQRRDRLSTAELVELRLDAVDRPDVRGALEGRHAPVIVTCRAASEGGAFAGAEEDRLRLLEEALDLGAEYVDVEWKALTPGFAGGRHRERIVVSMHDFEGLPRDLADRVAAMRRTGAGVTKVAVMASRLADGVTLAKAVRPRETPTVAIAMGEAGLASRVLASRLGSLWTYSGDDALAAPGQVSAERMAGEFRFHAIRPTTPLYGVVGRPVAHSLSPAMHNAAFAACGIDAVYLPLAAADFDDFLRFAEAMDLRGASVTAPFKVPAFELAGAADADGHQAGAINTLRRGDGGWEGRNTDAAGFMAPLAGRGPLAGQRATVLGAGGAARSVVMALRDAGASVTIVARAPERAADLARRAGVAWADWPPRAATWDLLVNATPLGTAPQSDQSPLDRSQLDGRLVYDLVYNPPRTRLLAEAAERGCETIGGLDMLVAQAGAQFAWWTGVTPPSAVMRQAALERLRETDTV